MAGGPGHGPRRSGKAREPLPAVRRGSDRQRGHRRSRLPGRRCLLVEIAPGEARERVERGRRLRAVRRDEDLVSLTDAEGGQAVEAPAARRTAPAREIDDLDARVEGRCSLNETGGRASVQAERVADVEAERQALLERSRGPDRSGNGGLAGAELCGPRAAHRVARQLPRPPLPRRAGPRRGAPTRAVPASGSRVRSQRSTRRCRDPSARARRLPSRPGRSPP